MITLLGVLVGLAIAGLAYLLYRVTVSFLKRYRERQRSQLVLGDMKDMIRNCPNKDRYSFSDLEDVKDKQIVAEYDPYSDDIVKANFVGREGMDYSLKSKLNSSRDGLIVIED